MKKHENLKLDIHFLRENILFPGCKTGIAVGRARKRKYPSLQGKESR